MTADTGSEPAPAAGSELSIPKHRFDEVAGELRRVREEMAIKDQLYLQDRQSRQQQLPPPEADPTPEETGLDPQTNQAVVKAAKRIAERMIAKERAVFDQQIGFLANRTEKTELLATKGADKAKYIPEIQREQQAHFQRTGGFLPAETAFEIIRSRENEERIKVLEAKLAGQAQAPQQTTQQVETPSRGIPPASGTQQLPSGGSPSAPANKTFGQLSTEEMEARLEEQFRSGNVL